MTGAVAVLSSGGIGFTVKLSTNFLTAASSSSPIFTSSVTASVNGGIASSYEWTRTDGGEAPIVIVSPSSATTNFSTGLPFPQTVTGTFICTAIVEGEPYSSSGLSVEITRT